MTRSKVTEHREAVIAAARNFARAVEADEYIGYHEEALVLAVKALNGYEPDPALDGPGSSVTGAPETSRRAAEMYVPAMKSVRRQIINDLYCRRGGVATDEMLERSLACKHQTLSSARNFLVAAGWVEDSRFRTTDKKAVLWKLTDAGRKMLQEANR